MGIFFFKWEIIWKYLREINEYIFWFDIFESFFGDIIEGGERVMDLRKSYEKFLEG